MGKARWIAAGLGLAVMGAVAAAAQSRETEQPRYETVLSDAAFELRDYAPILVAEVMHTGTRRQANGANFRRLAAYIFAQDRPDGSGERIALRLLDHTKSPLTRSHSMALLDRAVSGER